MQFVFTTRFYVLLALAAFPLSMAWAIPSLGYAAAVYDVLLICLAFYDFRTSRADVGSITAERTFDKRFAIGDAMRVTLRFESDADRTLALKVKDEYPPEMALGDERRAEFRLPRGQTAEFHYMLTPARRGVYHFGRTAVRFRSRLGLAWCQADIGEERTVKVYPNMRRAREIELKALGARSFLAIQRRAVRRGEGREFESMRDYVPGDELRHVSWTATARRGKLTSRQHQIERDQTVLIALDAGRLMTGRIGDESKFDTALHAALALMSASARAGDNCGIVVFGRRILRYIPPKRGLEHIDAVLEALHDVEPEIIEPSYARAFQFITANVKKRSFITILTDLIDKDSSKDLIAAIKLLRPRHLPMVATIGDRDLNEAVSRKPEAIEDVFAQSAAHEIIHQRESALRLVETLGGMAIDVTGATLAPKLLESYLRVKERGML